MKIRIGIFGYGNLGRAAAFAVRAQEDMTLAGVFSRRDPEMIPDKVPDVPFFPATMLFGENTPTKMDVLLLCGGSAQDLPAQTPVLARRFCVIDSFDTHAAALAHFLRVEAAARAGDRLAFVSVGWDPGLFSIFRALSQAVLPSGESYTFWGYGVSQGHSEAIRHLSGVKAARAYTIPCESMLAQVSAGERPAPARMLHHRLCFVVAEDGANQAEIVREIQAIPHYFKDDETEVRFVTPETFLREHSALPHAGHVIRNGVCAQEAASAQMRFDLALASNPAFTGSILVAYARALFRLYQRGERGCRTVLDVPPALLLPMSADDARKKFL